MDRLLAMKVFTSVVETGSFSRAADQLRLSPTATSRHIVELERHLGALLLQRSTRRLSLTEAGVNYYERCREILADVEEAEAAAGVAEACPRGVLRLSLPHSFGLRYVAPLLPGFCARYPELQLAVDFFDRVVDLVEGGFDVALRIAMGLQTTLVARELAPIRLICCASPDYVARAGAPGNPQELRAHRCLTYAYATFGDTWRFFREDKPYAVQVKGAFRANSGDAIRLAALAGLGIMMAPTFLVGADLRAGRLVRLLPDYEVKPHQAYAVYLPGARRSARVRAIYEYLREAFGPGEPPWDRDE